MRPQILFGVLVGLLIPSVAAADAADETTATFADALRQGRPILDLRYRHEFVSDDAIDGKNANATTLRTVVGYESKPFRGLRFRVEAEDVSVVGANDYANGGAGSAGNGVTGRPVVADPDGTAIHRAYVQWQGEKVSIQAGRDEINIGDHRFVGNVGWRQHHQSFDALSVRYQASTRWSLVYSRLESVQRINRAVDELDGDLIRAEAGLGAAGKLTLYGVHLDYDDSARWRFSSSTWGAEWTGDHSLGKGEILYELEYARQSDTGDNPGQIDADYTFVSLGYRGAKLTARGGWERLDGSARDGQFNTPLATLHKFDGWADKFLVTPTNGLVDRYVQLDGKLGTASWLAAYHDFEAATGGASYGSELDLQVLYKLKCGLGLGAKAAIYDADTHSTDTEKWMVWATYAL